MKNAKITSRFIEGMSHDLNTCQKGYSETISVVIYKIEIPIINSIKAKKKKKGSLLDPPGILCESYKNYCFK